MPGASYTTQKTHRQMAPTWHSLWLVTDCLLHSPRWTPAEATCARSRGAEAPTAAALGCWQSYAVVSFLFSKIIIHPISFLGFGQDTQDRSAASNMRLWDGSKAPSWGTPDKAPEEILEFCGFYRLVDKRRMLALREASKNMHPSLVLSPLSLAPLVLGGSHLSPQDPEGVN